MKLLIKIIFATLKSKKPSPQLKAITGKEDDIDDSAEMDASKVTVDMGDEMGSALEQAGEATAEADAAPDEKSAVMSGEAGEDCDDEDEANEEEDVGDGAGEDKDRSESQVDLESASSSSMADVEGATVDEDDDDKEEPEEDEMDKALREANERRVSRQLSNTIEAGVERVRQLSASLTPSREASRERNSARLSNVAVRINDPSSKAEAEAALKAASPWFGKADVDLLSTAIDAARAAGVDEDIVEPAEKKLAEARRDNANSRLSHAQPWVGSADPKELAASIKGAKEAGVDPKDVEKAEARLRELLDQQKPA
jgi:hypothetical protein